MSSPRLEVRLDAIRHNLRTVGQAVDRPLLAVVKADAYGHGAVPVARAAVEAGAQLLGVVDLAEALALRDAGITARILAWLHGPATDWRPALEAGIEVGVSAIAQLELLAAAAAGTGVTAQVHLKVDTGLGRNGAQERDWPWLLDRLAQLQQRGTVRVRGLFSHLGGAGREADFAQLAAFERARAAAARRGLRTELLHLAATAAALELPEARLDLVRLGIGLYGLTPYSPGTPPGLPLRPALRLLAPVRWRGARAVAEIGHADGLPPLRPDARLAAVDEAGWVWRILRVEDAETELVPPAGFGPGVSTELVLIGDGGDAAATVDDWAGAAGTISYEITTRLGARLPRIALDEAGPAAGLAAAAGPAPVPVPVPLPDPAPFSEPVRAPLLEAETDRAPVTAGLPRSRPALASAFALASASELVPVSAPELESLPGPVSVSDPVLGPAHVPGPVPGSTPDVSGPAPGPAPVLGSTHVPGPGSAPVPGSALTPAPASPAAAPARVPIPPRRWRSAPLRQARIDLPRVRLLLEQAAGDGEHSVDLSADAYGHGLALLLPLVREIGLRPLGRTEADLHRLQAAGAEDAVLDPAAGPRTRLAYDFEGRGVLRLVTELVHVKRVEAGQAVSYGYEWIAPAPVTLGLVPLGYGDGLLRRIGGRARLRFPGEPPFGRDGGTEREQRRPIVGRVAMDQVVLELGDLEAWAGLPVIVFGGEDGDPRLSELAAWSGLSPAAVTASLGSRIRRLPDEEAS